jgi:hypothetical protein
MRDGVRHDLTLLYSCHELADRRSQPRLGIGARFLARDASPFKGFRRD